MFPQELESEAVGPRQVEIDFTAEPAVETEIGPSVPAPARELVSEADASQAHVSEGFGGVELAMLEELAAVETETRVALQERCRDMAFLCALVTLIGLVWVGV